MAAPAVTRRTVDYGVGELLDVYRPDTGATYPVVLLWHGVGVAERHVLAHLAHAVAGSGAVVAVPDWRSTAPDRGRAHLLGSLDFARRRLADYGADTSHFVLAGWSRGARAGMGLLLRPEVVNGWRPSSFVGIAGGYGPRPNGRNPAAPTTGTVPMDDARSSSASPVPVILVHGTADPVVDIGQSRDIARLLRHRGWTVRLEEIEGANHTSVVWADQGSTKGLPGTSAIARQHGQVTADLILQAVTAA
jgi:dienelactone hydrolase